MDVNDMIESVRNYLYYFGDVNFRILDAMRFVDRKRFYPFIDDAYNDIQVSLDEKQVLLKPSVVGRILQLLGIESGDSVLGVGVGNGWEIALLVYLSKPGKVFGVDIDERMVESASRNITDFGFNDCEIKCLDFFDLVFTYDKIIFSCGIDRSEEKVMEDWLSERLNEGGRAVCPCIDGPLMVFEKKDGKIHRIESKEEYCFPELVS